MQTPKAIVTAHAEFLLGEGNRGYTLYCLSDGMRRLFPTECEALAYAQTYKPARVFELN